MSKLIKITKECLEECQKEFLEALSSGKFSDGKVTFTKNLGTIDRKATVYFTEIAWLKMQTLIREFSSEVGWHGIAHKGKEPDTYIISDILIYPQEVTGTTVTPDQEEYQMWLMEQDDEVFNNIRMQGHSHVNMGTSPSSVDTNFYDSILEQLDDSMFYIFMIWNKRGEKTVKIYDLKENVLFETSDTTIKIIDDELGMEKFLKEAKDLVKAKTYNTGVSRLGNTYSSYYGDYNAPSGYAKRKEESKKEPDKKDRKLVRKNKTYGNTAKSTSNANLGYEYDDDDDLEDYYDRGWRRRMGY